MAAHDETHAWSMPAYYDRYLVPLIFRPYAQELAQRITARAPRRVLETAAGTGAVTRELAAALPADTAIVATDLGEDMLEVARRVGTPRPVEWQPADAQRLPFPDGSFDAVVCQFGCMFFPDKPAAFAEARRVVRPGGVLMFAVWDRLEENEIGYTVERSLKALFPSDPPGFLTRAPYAYNDPAIIRRDLASGGLEDVRIDTVTRRSRAPSPREPAVGYMRGTPLGTEVVQRDPTALDRATDHAAEAVAARFGRGSIDAKIQALVITAER